MLKAIGVREGLVFGLGDDKVAVLNVPAQNDLRARLAPMRVIVSSANTLPRGALPNLDHDGGPRQAVRAAALSSWAMYLDLLHHVHDAGLDDGALEVRRLRVRDAGARVPSPSKSAKAFHVER